MESNQSKCRKSSSSPKRRGFACLSAFLATMLAGPAGADIDIPDDPLTTGARVAPNILFILDDSGSMTYVAMPKDITSWNNLDDDITDKSYVNNTIYYDPSKTYRPWLKADGETRMTGGTSYKSAYRSADLASGNKIDLSDETQTYFVPKPGVSDLTKQANYYRYQIREVGSGRNSSLRVVRSEYRTTNGSEGESGAGCNRKARNWQNCTFITPTGRTEEEEMENFAIWYSYHRTRMKAAKAGAGEAFASLDGTMRVGFRTIWKRGANHNNPIPVKNGDGRFVDDPDEDVENRSDWYDSLYSAEGSGGTPLQDALNDAGKYFSSASEYGPYGPERGSSQLSCRQNFTILTTDGYWNSGTAGSGNIDNQGGSTIKGAGGKTYQYSPEAPYKDDYTSTLADVAMKYWNTDLRTESYMGNSSNPEGNNVPSSSADPAFWQHMVTFGISIGLKTSKGWASVSDVPDNPSWPDPETGNTSGSAAIPARIDDLLHAAVNSRGEFVAASSPKEFSEGLTKALAAISQRTSSASNVAANSVSLDSESLLFNASYVAGIWTGNLSATHVSEDGIGDEAWTASIPAWGSRNVFTSEGGSGTTFPTAGQVELLERGGGPANFEVSGTDNANYIKGEQRLEENRDGTLRARTSILGDIINSSPAYVKDTNTIYVGANDGMLHAFDAADGEELFAYVPGLINIGTLSRLSRGDYAHRFFVDGPVTVSSRRVTPDRNLLVGTLGRGGKGVYSLDVSTPSSFAGRDVKWELAETPGSNMGLVLGKPLISRVQGNANAAVVIGNGVNSVNNQAVLVIVDAGSGAVIREISTGTGSAAQPNGLFAPTGIYGSDGKSLAYVYAGDMLGNVWKFDLTSTDSTSWSARRIFSAVDGAGTPQPVTGGLAVAIHPVTNKRWIFFGTGRYLTVQDADTENVSVQSMYGFMDDDDPAADPVARGDLTQRTVQVLAGEADGFEVRAFESKAKLPVDSKGWYIDLPDSGERIVQDAQVVSTFLVTASMVPTGNACGGEGTGYINALDAFTGTSAGGSYFDLDGDGSTSDDKVNDLPVGSVNLGVGMPTLPNLLRGLLAAGGSGGGPPGGTPTLPPRWDRASWREIRGN